MFLVRRPSSRDIETFLEQCREAALSYEPLGIANQSPADSWIDEQITPLGSGPQVFERAKQALAGWGHFELGWVELLPQGAPISRGTNVAVLIRHLGCWSLNGCRVVYSIAPGADAEFGFAYGTLTNHAECGEEIVLVRKQPDTHEVSYVIRAVSKPRALLARLGSPVVRSLQAQFRRDLARAMQRWVEDARLAGQDRNPE